MSIFNPNTGCQDYISNNCINLKNSVTAVHNTITTTANKLNFPEEADQFILRHIDQDVTIWIGPSADITAGGAGTFPLLEGDALPISLQDGNENELYAIVASGSTTLYIMGTITI